MADHLAQPDSAEGPAISTTEIFLKTLDEVFQSLAQEDSNKPILAFPKSRYSPDDYEQYDGRDLDRFIESGVNLLVQDEIQLYIQPSSPQTVAVYGISDLDYLVTIASLIRLGLTPLLLHPSLDRDLCVKLCLQNQISIFMWCKDADLSKAIEIFDILKQHQNVTPFPMFLRHRYYDCTPPPIRYRDQSTNRMDMSDKVVLITYSSLDEIKWTNRDLIRTILDAELGSVVFNMQPLYHVHGLIMTLAAMVERRMMFHYDHHVTVEGDTVYKALVATEAEMLVAAPAVLKFLVERRVRIRRVQESTGVLEMGGRSPDELKDVVLRNWGVGLEEIYPLLETSLLIYPQPTNHNHRSTLNTTISPSSSSPTSTSISNPSFLPSSRWSYFSHRPHTKLHLELIHLNPITHTLLTNQGLDTASALLNPHNPPILTSMLLDPLMPLPFLKPPFTGPLNSRFLLSNSTSLSNPIPTPNLILPLPLEWALKFHLPHLISEALMFGAGKEYPGLLVFRTQFGSDVDEEVFERQAEGVVRGASVGELPGGLVRREMVLVAPVGGWWVSDVMGRVDRRGTWDRWEGEIEGAYRRFEGILEGRVEGSKEEEEEEGEERRGKDGEGMLFLKEREGGGRGVVDGFGGGRGGRGQGRCGFSDTIPEG